MAAAFFAFGFAAVTRGFLAGRAAGFGPLPEALGAGVSACFSGSFLDFLATFSCLECLRDRIPVERGLQADFAKRLREETDFAYRAPCDTL